MNRMFVICFLAFSSMASAVDYPTMEEFYADDANLEKYNTAIKQGVLEKGNEMMAAQCIKEARGSKEALKECDCISKAVNDADPKEWFYETTMQFKMYQDTAQAFRENNAEKRAEIEAYRNKRNSEANLASKIMLACERD